METIESLIGKDFGWGPIDLESAKHWASWHPATGNHKGWRVTKGLAHSQEHEDRGGRLITFKTMEAAQRRADELNSKPN